MDKYEDVLAFLPIEDVLRVAQTLDWTKAARFKYLTLRLDTRTMSVRIYDRHGTPVSLATLERKLGNHE